VTSSATWQSSVPSVATVSSTGLVTAVNPGTSTISATYQGRPGTLIATVSSSATAGAPGAFGKSSPPNGGTVQPTTSITLSWQAASAASSYEYCLDATLNNSCDATWLSTGSATSVTVSLPAGATAFSWQARARNSFGTTEADGGAWWSFQFLSSPAAFGKLAPANGSVIPPSPSTTLSWETSGGALSYEYCVDTTNNNSCDTGWVSTGTATSATASLPSGTTTYFWQVRARTSAGTTEANAGTWWNFRLGVCCSELAAGPRFDSGTVAAALEDGGQKALACQPDTISRSSRFRWQGTRDQRSRS